MNGTFERPTPRVVIVGAGFGGLRCAVALRHAPVAVTVIDRGNAHVFQPMLYQVATAALSPADISAPIRSVLRAQHNVEVMLGEVTGVDAEAKRVHVRGLAGMPDRDVPYEYLVLATGARESYFGHDDWRAFAPGLKTLEDATEIRRKILLAFEAAEAISVKNPARAQTLLTFVVVGGGPTGVELAGAIAEVARKALLRDFRHINPASARIVLVEAEAHLLSAYPEALARRAAEKLRRLGVEVRTNSHVEAVEDGAVIINGQRLAAETVLWAAGVQASPAGRWLGTETDRAGRAIVLPDLSVPGQPNVFVVGDTARVKQGEQPLPGIAPVAMQEGRYVARVIRARVRGDDLPAPFAYFDKGTLATVGRAFAIADIRGFKLSGFIAWVTWLAVHIFFLIGFRNRVLVMFQWAWAYLTYQRGARLITYIEGVQRQPTEATAAAEPPAAPLVPVG